MFKKFVLAVDGSDSSKRAAEAARSLATRTFGEVEILHLRERQISKAGAYDTETSDEAAELVDGYLRDFNEAGVKATAEVHTTVVGRAAQGILEEAKRFEADTIVMGSRGMSDWAALLLGASRTRSSIMQSAPS